MRKKSQMSESQNLVTNFTVTTYSVTTEEEQKKIEKFVSNKA